MSIKNRQSMIKIKIMSEMGKKQEKFDLSKKNNISVKSTDVNWMIHIHNSIEFPMKNLPLLRLSWDFILHRMFLVIFCVF